MCLSKPFFLCKQQRCSVRGPLRVVGSNPEDLFMINMPIKCSKISCGYRSRTKKNKIKIIAYHQVRYSKKEDTFEAIIFYCQKYFFLFYCSGNRLR